MHTTDRTSSDIRLDLTTVMGKAVAVLDAFGADEPYLTLAQLTRRTGLAKGTLHAVVMNLVGNGLLSRDAKGYSLSTRLFALGMRASVGLGLIEAATPFLEDLYVATRQTVHLGVRDGFDVVYIAKIGGHRQVAAPSRIAGRMPLHCTALGKVLLANARPDVVAALLERGLSRVAPRTIVSASVLREQLAVVAQSGIAYEYEESAVGIACVAAPVTADRGEVVAAVSVTGSAITLVAADHRARVKAAGAGISAAIARQAELRNEMFK